MDTIAAIVTAQGTAAVSIIRISGSKSHEIVKFISNISDDELKPEISNLNGLLINLKIKKLKLIKL